MKERNGSTNKNIGSEIGVFNYIVHE